MKKRLMLIVDDIEVNRNILAESFEEEFDILHAKGGKQAIQIVEQYQTKLTVILLDIIMPDMDGIAVLRWLKSSGYDNIPVIAVTAEPHYQLEALEAGAWDFISKPVDNRIIRARINNVLGRYDFEGERRRSEQLLKTTHEMNNLINSIPGGIAIYKLTERGFETQYFSDGVAQLTGHTREEHIRRIGIDAASIIYSEDRHKMVDAAVDALRNGKAIDETYRIYHKNGSLVWVRLNGVVIGEEDGAPLIHAVLQTPARMAQLYDNLVNETPSLIYVSDISNHELMYINEAALENIGKKSVDYSGKKCYEFLMGRTEPCPFCKVGFMNADSFLEYEFTSPLSGKIYSMRGKLTDWNGISAHVEYVQDITKVRTAEQENRALTRQLQSVMENIPGGMCMYRIDSAGIHPAVHNEAFFEIFGYLPEHRKAVMRETDFLNVHPEDLPGLKSKIEKAIRTNARVNYTYRCFNEEKNRYIWINLNGVIVPQEDRSKVCYVSYTDVTEEREIQEKLRHAQQVLEELRRQAQSALDNYQVLVNAVPGGIAQYEIVNGQIRTRFISDGLCALSGYTQEEYRQMGSRERVFIAYDEDYDRLMDSVNAAIEKKENLSISYRMHTKSGQLRWVHLNAAYARGQQGECFYQAVFTDVDKLKKIEQELQENQLRYEVAIKSSGINIWEYDIQKDCLRVISNSARIKQNCFQIENYVQSTLTNGFVREDSIQKFLGIFERLRRGEREVTEDIWYRTTEEAGWWCERATYTAIFDEAGNPVRAFGAGRDVTREREAEKKFQEELAYRKAIQSENLSTVSIDLTDDRVLEVSSTFKTVSELEGDTAEEYFRNTLEAVTGEHNRKKYEKIFAPKALLRSFDNGEFETSMDLTRLYDDNKVYWIHYSAHLVRNQLTGNVIAHISCADITNEKVMQTIMETIAKVDYDSFVVVDGVTNSALDYGIGSRTHMYSEKLSFEAQNEEWLRRNVCKQDMERVIESCKINNVWTKLKSDGIYKFSFGMCMPDGSVRRKQLQFYHIDDQRKTFLMSQIDVENIYAEQETSKKALQTALDKAEQATRVKTDFLSRMSHDMRTPMNAILGFSSFGLDSKELSEAREYFRKIHGSGEYLLQLINDTLDLSKLETRTLKVYPEPYAGSEFVETLKNMLQAKAEEKGISLNVENSLEDSGALMFDKLRLQQIFINLLNNAIKFTPAGGHVALKINIEPDPTDETMCSAVFTVMDDGIGMTEDFRRNRLYTPFEQEHRVENTESGTGLGLSIVRELVTAMDGTISCRSMPGKGTTFTVRLRTKMTTAEKVSEAADEKLSYELDGKRILVCEDHPINREIACKLLRDVGAFAETAENGQAGFELFRASESGYYQAILMDIRMPVCDGLEATRKIRALDHPDAKSIPIIAMTANAFHEDVQSSKAAGMNAHLSKPINPQMLYQTLAKLTAGDEKRMESVK